MEVMALFQELGQSGITILLVTHEPAIGRWCPPLVPMRDGRILTDRRQSPMRPDPELFPLQAAVEASA